jgi:hypothetical protein
MGMLHVAIKIIIFYIGGFNEVNRSNNFVPSLNLEGKNLELGFFQVLWHP